ncbi:hypothetical protein ACFE04_025064 [Oxalis oulophora]
MENGFSSPRSDSFPAGLRVLVVDDDPTWLKILEKMLKKCSYEVTTCALARDALSLLRERKEGYDIVISDVNMPDMDGFILLEHVGLEMDLPVIMMSVDGETSRVMKGVQHGACDYLLKPIRMKELRNIWQHVFRKKIHEVRDIEGFELTRNGSDQSDDGHDMTPQKKRKDLENKYDDKDFGDSCSTKKARVVWSVDLHQKFVKAVHQIGFDKVGPKKILDSMNVPWLTRENVASHLQKYRLYLTRLQKENELKNSLGGIKNSETPSKDSSGSFGLPNSGMNNNNDASNVGGYGFSGSKRRIQNVDPNYLEDDQNEIISVSQEKPKRDLTIDIPDRQMKSPQVNLNNHSYGSLEPDVNFAPFDPAISKPSSWNEMAKTQFKESKPLHSEEGFSKRHQPEPHIRPDFVPQASSTSPRPSVTESNKPKSVNINPFDVDFPLQPKNHTVNHQSFEPIFSSSPRMKTQEIDLSCSTDLEFVQGNLNHGFGTPAGYMDENSHCTYTNVELHSIDIYQFEDYDDSWLYAAVPISQYDTPRIQYNGLFIA